MSVAAFTSLKFLIPVGPSVRKSASSSASLRLLALLEPAYMGAGIFGGVLRSADVFSIR